MGADQCFGETGDDPSGHGTASSRPLAKGRRFGHADTESEVSARGGAGEEELFKPVIGTK
jgi:hypothetical protein